MILHQLQRLACPAAFVLSLSLLSVPIPALAQEDLSAEELQAQAQKLGEDGLAQLENEEFQAAEESFTKLIQMTRGQRADVYLMRAKARKGLENFTGAQEDVKSAQEAALDATAITPVADNLNGEIYLEEGAIGEALILFQKAVAADSSNIEYQFNLGKASVMAGDIVTGEASLSKWIDAEIDDSEKNAEAYRLRAQAFAGLGKFEEAKADIDKTLQIDPDDHEIYALKGVVQSLEEDYEGAAESFRVAIEKFEPEEGSDLPYIEGHLRRASVLTEAAKLAEDDPEKERKLYQECVDECQRLIDALPDRREVLQTKSSALFSRGVAERMLGNLTKAVNTFTEAIDINPAFSMAFFRRGICFYHLDEEMMAIKDFDKSRNLDVESPHAALWKGRTFAKMGNYYEALKAYGQALAISDRYTEAYVNRGLAYMRLGEFDKAVVDFNDAIRLQTNNPKFFYYRGVAYSAMGNHKKAVQSFATAIDLDEDHAEAHLQLAKELMSLGRGEIAREYQQRGEELMTSGQAE